MTGVLNVDTIADNAGTGPVTLTKQQAAKSWVLFSMTAPGITDDFNISSLTDDSTGHGTLSFTNSMANATYATSAGASDEGAGPITYGQHNLDTKTSSTVQVSAMNRNGSASDTVKWEGCFHGDLA